MIEMIEELATLDNWDKIIDVLPSSQKRVRKSERSKILPLQFPESHLYTEFLKNVEKNPESVAIIDSDSGKRTSYKELKDIGLRIAAYLKNKGIKQGDYIAITLPRGYRQIYAIITEDILKQNQGKIIGYTYLENTIFFQKDYQDIEKEFSEFEYKVGKAEYIKTMFKEKFDIVILPNSLHRFNDIEVQLQEVSTILKTDGYLFACEPNRNLLIVDVVPSIIEKGFAHIDISKRGGGIIPDAGKMSDLLEKSGYKVEYINEMKQGISHGSLFLVGTLYDKKRVTFNNLESYLEKELPSYMMPFAFYLVDEFPINKNGKVDRKKLNDRVKVYSEEKESKLFKNNKNLQMNKTQSIVKDIFEQVFKGKKLDIDDNYFSLGGDSLTATQIIGSLRNQYNINVSIRNIFENPSILELARFIDKNTTELPEENKAQLFVDKEEEYKPFPLTNVQFAYWIGRKGAFNMGRVSTHCYFEFECEDLDIPKFQKVWNDMIIHHGMLRDVVCESGEQKILKEVPMYLIQTASLVGFEEKVQEEYLTQVRKEMSGQCVLM